MCRPSVGSSEFRIKVNIRLMHAVVTVNFELDIDFITMFQIRLV